MRSAVREVALTADQVWRAAVSHALQLHRRQTSENTEPATILRDALLTLASIDGATAAAAVAGLDFSSASRKGAVRVSVECQALAADLCKKLSATMSSSSGVRWTLRTVVLTSLYMHAAALAEAAAPEAFPPA